MTKKDIFIIIFYILLLIVLVIGSIKLMVFIFSDSTSQVIEPQKQEVYCEHEFVTVSEYDWIFKSYRTFSKCRKCGLEVK